MYTNCRNRVIIAKWDFENPYFPEIFITKPNSVSEGQKSGQKASVVDFWTYNVGQKSGQKVSVVLFK